MTTPTLPHPGVTAATRQEFLALLAAAGLLSGCAGASTNPPGATRPVEQLGGTSEIPIAPRRVVALEDTTGMAAIELGLPPVGASSEFAGFLTDLAAALPPGVDAAAIPTVSTSDEPDLEAIAAIGPDLILGTELGVERYPQLRAIAPTVLIDRGANGRWRARFREVAEVLDRGDRADEIEDGYQRVLDSLPAVVRETTVGFVRPSNNGGFRIDGGAAALAGSVAVDAALATLQVPSGVGTAEGYGFREVSGEFRDVLAPAGLIVVPDYRSVGEESDGVSQLAANPLWSGLPAVAAGRVLQVPGLVYNGGCHYAAQLLLRSIITAVAGVR